VTASKENRQTPWTDIPQILGWECGEKAIRTALKKEGYARRVARKKCPLTEESRLARLAWAIQYYDWTDEQWDKILWSDETWTQPGRHTKIWVTRRPEEVNHKDCVQSRFQRKIGWMFWGSISGKYGKHKGLFWEKDWETINEGSYCGIIIPMVDEILQQYPELQFQQDNAKGHASAFTKSVLKAAEIRVIEWPPYSPDLNPIEELWDDMKDYIQEHYPQVHRSYKRLRQAVQEAWDSITHERIKELVHSMRARCFAVIRARGWYTEY
jgi:transposase